MALVRPSTRHFLEYLPGIGLPTTVLGYVSSGPLTANAAPVPLGSTANMAFTGNSSLGGHPTFPLTVTVPFPSGLLPGDIVVAKLKLQGVFPGVGSPIGDLSPLAGWTEDLFQLGA